MKESSSPPSAIGPGARSFLCDKDICDKGWRIMKLNLHENPLSIHTIFTLQTAGSRASRFYWLLRDIVGLGDWMVMTPRTFGVVLEAGLDPEAWPPIENRIYSAFREVYQGSVGIKKI